MKKIKCPDCGREFQPTRSGYDLILQQVRNEEFQAEIDAYKKAIDAEKEVAIREIRVQTLREAEQKIAILQESSRAREHQLERKNYESSEHYRNVIAEKDQMIQDLRNFQTRLSTKMVGESLELHCEAAFNQLRTSAFPDAYFEKDNDITEGSKGDYIYREVDESGVELLSIMFEMKNESAQTLKKRKNEDFFKELDKDRKQKKCEYAVLVSMLELDNEFYNCGIADVSYRYPKMYVVRPQCFITIISILRNAALNTLAYKKEVARIKARNIDMEALEINMENFKDSFGRNYQLASDKFSKAIEEIDKTILMLQKTKADLLSSGNNLRIANEKAQDLTIEKLTKPKTAKSRKKTTKSGK